MNGDLTEVHALFHNLDAPFLRYDKDKVEPIHWRTRDFLVQFHHEVKVPATAGSIVKFSFSTTNGDVSFALHFVTPQGYVEVVRDSTREPSDIEAIKGSYKADYDGMFIFIFDNSYSWFTDKFISYDIYLFQVSLAVVTVLTPHPHPSLLLHSQRLFKQMPIASCKAAACWQT